MGYTKPGEKVLIFMDVNNTVTCSDSVQGKDTAASLLGTMFECIQFTPKTATDLEWDPFPKLQLNRTRTLKELIKDLTRHKDSAYAGFWSNEKCFKLVGALLPKGRLSWVGKDNRVTMQSFRTAFEEYLQVIGDACDAEGICKSWYKLYEDLTTGRLCGVSTNSHAIFLNSFGVDTMKVVKLTTQTRKSVMQITVNFELWDTRDKERFSHQFAAADTAKAAS